MYYCKPVARQLRNLQYSARGFHASIKLEEKRRAGLHEGKVAICAGCTDGTGYEMAKRLAEEGAHVVVGSRKQANVDDAVDRLKSENLKASGIVCHVGNSEHRKELVRKASEIQGGVDILINNAAANVFTGPMLETPESAFDKAYDVNIKSTFCLIQETVPHMTGRTPFSSIIITGSTAAYHPQGFPGAYVVSKGALFVMTKALMPELLQRNIRVNCVSLGIFDTVFGKAITENERLHKLAMDFIIPMKRYGKPEECAGLVSFLCSDDASYITGQNFMVSGGTPTGL